MSATQAHITKRMCCKRSWSRLWCRSAESTCLAPMWPWLKPGPGVISALHFSVVGSRPCSEEIFSGFSSFPLSTKIDIAKYPPGIPTRWGFVSHNHSIWYKLSFLVLFVEDFCKWNKINCSNWKCYGGILLLISLKLSIINLTQRVKFSWLVSRDPRIEHLKHTSVSFLFESAFSNV